MYLKSMTIFGFKSFATKVNLTFTSGVAAIVGPNGCGKSNIADAIKWALGESNARPLRGASMQDVIFSGTKTRRGVGLAEVSLVFDNADRLLPLDFDEVSVSRKLFKSGESEYSINGVNCRQRDIFDIFAGTGLGREAYSVVEQGKVDALLSARAEDRRAVFDEASGIMKYKVRKKESERKLQDVQTNKIRIEDLISELDTNLPEISRQADVALDYRNIAKEIKELELMVNINDAKECNLKFSEVSEKLTALSIKEQDISFKISERDANLESMRFVLLQNDSQLEEVHLKLSEAKSRIERAEGNYNLLQERLSSLAENLKRLENERDAIKKDEYKSQEEYGKLQIECDATSKSFFLLTREVKDLETEYALFEEKSSSLLKQLENYKYEIFDISSKIAELKNRKLNISSQSEGFSFRIKRLLSSCESKQQELDDAEAREKILVDSFNKVKTNISEKQSALEEYVKVEKLNLDLLNKIKGELLTLENSKNKLTATSQALFNLESNYEGYTKAIKYLFGQFNGKDKGLLGTVSELIDVPSGYESAFEAALGGALQNIIVSTSQNAEDAIAALKSSNSGKATFLPLDMITAYTLSPSEIPLKESGYLGVASELAKFDAKNRRAIEHLLGRCVIIDTLKNAVAIRKKGFKCKMVTVDGEILSSGGAITGGMVKDRESSGLLSRKNRIKEINVKLAELEESIAKEIKDRDEKETELFGINRLKEEINKELSSLYLEEKSFEERNISLKKDVLRLKEEVEAILEEISTIESGKTENINIISNIEKDIAELEAKKVELESSYDMRQSQQETFSETENEMSRKLTEERVHLAERKAAHSSIVRDLGRIKDALESLEGKIKNYDQEIEKVEESIESLNEQSKSALLEHDRLLSDQENIDKELDLHRESKQKTSSSISKAESELKSLRRSLTSATEQARRLDIEKAKYITELAYLEEKLATNHDLKLEDAYELETQKINRQEVLDTITELTERIESLGPINHAAVEEYKAVKERYDFLIYQLNDLNDASESLKEVIREIERTCRKQFMDVYSKIQIEFKSIYSKLFGGGEAELKLTNEEDPLEGGVEIICQPPGKKLTSLSLLSGGERALTAIALIFSIIKLLPSSFCILDEIDSALDEANVDKFGELVKEFSENMQILLITHRKGTMENADYIYGVTMEEFGVSKVFSVSPAK